jgi:hypothetical protein
LALLSFPFCTIWFANIKYCTSCMFRWCAAILYLCSRFIFATVVVVACYSGLSLRICGMFIFISYLVSSDILLFLRSVRMSTVFFHVAVAVYGFCWGVLSFGMAAHVFWMDYKLRFALSQDEFSFGIRFGIFPVSLQSSRQRGEGLNFSTSRPALLPHLSALGGLCWFY